MRFRFARPARLGYPSVMLQPTSSRQRQFFVLFLLALLPAGNALNPCLDVDTWWHLRVGQSIVNEKKLPDHDSFSQLGHDENIPWTAYSWLYEIGLFEAYEAGGFAGIMVCRNVFDLMTFCGIAWLLLRHAASGWVALATLAAVTVSLLPFMPERPWHFTIFSTTLTLHAVSRIREGTPARRFAWLPLLYIFWANIHIQFVMGFALLGLAWGTMLIERWRTKDRTKDAAIKGLFVLGLACTLATLITPFHFRLYLVIWEYVTQTGALQLVSELNPPDLTRWWNWPLIVLLPIAAGSVARRGYRLWDLVLLASALFFSLRMQRDLWYGVLIAGTLIVRNVPMGTKNEWRIAAWHVVLVSVLAQLLMRCVWEMGMSQGKTFASCHAKSFPVGAVEHIRSHKLVGPLFNNFDWGGYLIWALPELPVSIDGRTNLYGDARLKRSMDTWQGANWEDDLDLRNANIVIAPNAQKEKEFPLTELLRKSEHWKIDHEDETAVVFVRVKGP